MRGCWTFEYSIRYRAHSIRKARTNPAYWLVETNPSAILPESNLFEWNQIDQIPVAPIRIAQSQPAMTQPVLLQSVMTRPVMTNPESLSKPVD